MGLKKITVALFFFLSILVDAQSLFPNDRNLRSKLKLTQSGTDKLKVKKINKLKKSSSDGLIVSSIKPPRSLNDHDKVARHTVKRKGLIVSVRDFFCKSCIESKTDCPDKVDKKKSNEYDHSAANANSSKANILRSTNSVHFDVVQLEDIHLDIPAFKQFKNNMTDFTADGEHEFQEIIHKIGIYLGTNYEGKGVTLKIIGSASQIPTSFDPGKPNNNINPDGSSIIGRTSIQNNVKLAKARADELAKKIIAVFPSIEIVTPSLQEIELGKTKWDAESQKNLNIAFGKKDKQAMKAVYEPFQKDQWVKVESKEKTSRSIKPESIRMYMVSTSPYLKTNVNGEETIIRSLFIVSKKTYDAIGENKSFNNVEDRDKFLDELDLKVFSSNKNGLIRWYFLQGLDEIITVRNIRI